MNFPKIGNEAYATRVAALTSKMKQQGIDMVIAFSNLLDPSAVRYFCDFAAVNESAAIIIMQDGNSTVCSGQASYDYAKIKNRLAGSELKVFPEIGEVSGFEYNFEGQLDFKQYFEELKSKYKVKKIGVMGRLTFPAIIYNKLKSVFADAELIDADGLLYSLRLIKTPDEIAVLNKCWEIISSVFTDVVPQIRAGMTELEVQALLESDMLKKGGESYVQAFAPMVAAGPENSYISMCRSTLRKLGEGEIINLAAGVCYEGYNGIICSPYALGKIPQKIKDAVKCAYDALNVASARMKPGAGTKEIMTAYTEYLTKYGYIEFCPYGSLHSTGMLECEAPVFSEANDRLIEENMCICIDAYFKGMEWGSFRIEDCYAITKNGAGRMTTYNDKALPKIFF
ncbi:hypothetical protein FACS1894211_14090 [Clostridia bacterium]|nr:hypothetical protein FACS1894211_14090 [Clostridia bacterium]